MYKVLGVGRTFQSFLKGSAEENWLESDIFWVSASEVI